MVSYWHLPITLRPPDILWESMRTSLDAIPVIERVRIAVAKLPNELGMLSPPTAVPQIFPLIW